PEFEAATGMKVELKLLPFGEYNAMIDRELASEQPAFDFINVTFFLAAQWVASGRLANLDEFTADANVTPAEWAPADFVAGAQLPYRDAKGGTYAYAWEGGATIMGVSRMDLMERKGLLIPRTFEELRHVCAEIHQPGEVNGFVSWHLHHWCLIPYLQGFGGDVFADAPSDTTPTLSTDQAVQALEFYASLLKYAPLDVSSYTEDQARASLAKGRSNVFIHSSSWVAPSLLANDSRVRDTARIARMPVGPLFDRPASNSQGLGIPRTARNRAAAWEFVKWALSPDMTARIMREHGHASVCRRSVIESEAYRAMNKVNGQDLGALYLDVLERPTRGKNYMAYRTVRQFPIVGDCINAAVDSVISGRASARDALNTAQALATARLART
ncbi:ABC transporter substrate-binding protein, partial [Bradyrhizobium sp. SRS-191]|uniref:ABC transporter substrate-binding protein n=1 Tax=Bradyrhizobium sp. SRS-191 TaxID=2962606 RepID=UPI00211E463A